MVLTNVQIKAMPNSEKRLIRFIANKKLAKISYAKYFMLANSGVKDLQMFNYTKYICDQLQEIVEGKQKHLILELPPQHGKSTVVTETFPSYFLMRHPDSSVMVTSYGEDMYKRFAKKNIRHFSDWGNRLFGLRVGRHGSNVLDVAGHLGEAYFTSIHGGGTGRPADLLIIDDPIKDAREAKSATIKADIWNEWALTFSTRLQHNASIIVIMTRWQVDDLAGRLLNDMAYPWQVIKFPAIAEDIPAGQTDIIGRHNGEALNPVKHPIEDLLKQKKNIGSHSFAALYQQRPTLEDGNIIKREWIKFYVDSEATAAKYHLKGVKILPRHLDNTIQSWDATFKDQESDDFVAGTTWSSRGADMFLRIGWTHKRLGFTDTCHAIEAQTRLYPYSTAKLIEDKANGPAIIDSLKHKIAGITAVSPGSNSKEARFASVSPYFESGNVYLPHPDWYPRTNELIEELCGFPAMPHDDYVDSTTYAIDYLTKHKRNTTFGFIGI